MEYATYKRLLVIIDSCKTEAQIQACWNLLALYERRYGWGGLQLVMTGYLLHKMTSIL